MKSELCQIPGVGPKMASYLEQQEGSRFPLQT